jgi:hypothetical protein
MDMVFTVATTAGQNMDDTKGSWFSLSPMEMIHALVTRVGEACATGAEKDELMKWRKLLLNCTMAFECISNEDVRHWRHLVHVIASAQQHHPGCRSFGQSIDADEISASWGWWLLVASIVCAAGPSSCASKRALVMPA